jgi:hypothetical protein
MNIPNVNPTNNTGTAPAAPTPITPKTGPVLAERKIQASKKSVMTVDARLYGVKPMALSKYINDMIKVTPFSGVVYNKTMLSIVKQNAGELKQIRQSVDQIHTALLAFNVDFFKTQQETIKQFKNIELYNKKPNITTQKLDTLIKGEKDDRRRQILADRQAQKDAYDPYDDPMYKVQLESNDILQNILKQGALDKKKTESGGNFLSSLLKALPLLAGIGGLLGFLLTGKGEFLTDMLKPLKLGFAGIKAGIHGIKIAFSGVKLAIEGIKGVAKGVVDIFGKITGKVFKAGAEIAGKVGEKIAGSGVGKAIGKGAEFAGKGFKMIGKGAAAAGKFSKITSKLISKAAEKSGIKIIGKVGAKIAAKIPGVGIVIGSAFAIDRLMRGDYTGAGLEFTSGILSTIPVVGTAASVALDVGIAGRDVYRTATGANKNEKTGIYEALAGKGAGKGAGKDKKPTIKPMQITNAPLEMKKGNEPFNIKIADDTVHMEGLHPSVYNNFMGMAQEYNQSTGKNIQVNSAFRTFDEQTQLYRQNPKKAARPGHSLHETGLAIDIQPSDADKAANLGLMNKYGFHRPLLNAAFPEAWHLQPKTLASTAQDSPKGDPVPVQSKSPEITSLQNTKNEINRSIQNNVSNAGKQYSEMLSTQKSTVNGLSKVVNAVNNITTTNTSVIQPAPIAG